MTKTYRIGIFLAALLVLGVIHAVFRHTIVMLGDRAIPIFAALMMLSFITLLAEHYFTRPTDVVASSLSALLLISPAYALLSDTGVWYWVVWTYCAVLFLIALLSLLFATETRPASTLPNRVSKSLYKIAITFGNGRLIWFFVFVVATLFYVDSQSPLFVTLLLYSGVLLTINPSKAMRFLRRGGQETADAVGEIFSVQSETGFLAKTVPNAPPIKRFDIVGFSSKAIDAGSWKAGLVLETYQLNQQRWLRILTSSTFSELSENTTRPLDIDDSAVYLLKAERELQILKSLVGTVCENSDIHRIRFEYAFRVEIEEGELVEVAVRSRRVLYQVIQGITGVEPLESRDEAGKIIGEAIQLGVWNADTRRFDRFGWVPVMNSPVVKASAIDAIEPLPNEYKIGDIPGTSFPVFIDLDAAVTHHLAVLGVTGSGKSVFSRDLVRRIAGQGTKVICVDFTSEYADKLSDLLSGTLISETNGTSLFDAIDCIGTELDKFANQRDKNAIAQFETTLNDAFQEALASFVKDDRKAVLFELPDVTNSTGILEYTKWFFKSLFQLAKAKAFHGRRICVVLEEAHTVVPEWNFLGVEDKRSSTVVNSISQIALQGRKYGVGFIVIAQRTANVSKTVLTQCNSVVAFQQFDKTSADFLANHMGSGYLSTLTRLKSRHAIAVGKAFSSGTPMIFEVPEIVEPAATGDEADSN